MDNDPIDEDAYLQSSAMQFIPEVDFDPTDPVALEAVRIASARDLL
ncbi:MAG: hypothetical protein WAX14_08380 [Rhodococcus sp. (in: high G+C Gram-positive bacteria)]